MLLSAKIMLILLVAVAPFGILGAVVLTGYDRAAVVSGRSEVLRVWVEGGQFSEWILPRAQIGSSFDVPAEPQTVRVVLLPGTQLRFVRSGQGDLRLDFKAAGTASACPEGGSLVGRNVAGEAEVPICDIDMALVRLIPGAAPLTLAVQGEMAVGEAVRPGGGAQPVLLSATVALFVRPSGRFFDAVCSIAWLEVVCERYEASGTALSAGDEAVWAAGQSNVQATGFIRVDPAEAESGFRFDIAAGATALQVFRLKGEGYRIQETIFERIVRSPLIQNLVAIFAIVGGFCSAVFSLWQFLFRRSGTATAVLVLLAGASAAQAQQPVHIEARETGQGFLLARGDRCQAVTVEHVLGRPDQEDRATEVSIVAAARQNAEASFVRRIPSVPEALMVLDVRGPASAACPRFPGVSSLDTLLRSSAAELRMQRRDGGTTILPLRIQAVDFEVFLVHFETQPARGMSGGMVLIAGHPAGLLVDVDAVTGIGRVARMDRIMERLAPWFTAGYAAPAPPPPPVAEEGLRLRIVSWSVPPSSPQERASGLEQGQVWRIAADRTGDLVLELPAATVLSAVSLGVAGLPDPPRNVEILASPAGTQRWSSLGTLALEPGDESRRLTFAPRRAGFIMIRLFGPQPGQRTMALGSVSAQ